MVRSNRTPGVRVDSLEPSVQNPNARLSLGTSGNPWKNIYGSKVICSELVRIQGPGQSGIYTESYQTLLSPADTSFTIQHFLNSRNLHVVVLDTDYVRVIPNMVQIPDAEKVLIDFVEPQAGIVVIYKGGV
ncbi:MAG: hypothetical protein MN733_42025 [Nitrososphaera sp.]|nr:hypothetical protein [Nitrososphaera sp.]